MVEGRIFFLFLLISSLLSVIVFAISLILVPRSSDIEKVSAYECGFQPFEDARQKFDVRFYLTVIMFVIFDLEIVLLFPWSIALISLGSIAFFSVAIFMFILLLGFLFELESEALDWS